MNQDKRIIALTHAAGASTMMTLLAAGISSPRLIVLEDDHRMRADRLLDEIDLLSLFIDDDRPQDRMGFRHPHPRERPQVTHVDTPKPMSKRKARRLRGKGAA